MKMQSSTFTSVDWNSDVAKDLQTHYQQWIQSLKKQNFVISGFLQSFTFPKTMTQEQCFDLGDLLSEIYKSENYVLLGGDTSQGKSLTITLIAFLESETHTHLQ